MRVLLRPVAAARAAASVCTARLWGVQVVNQGKVAFDFAVDLSRLSRQGVVEAAPMKGSVAAGDKERVKLKAR